MFHPFNRISTYRSIFYRIADVVSFHKSINANIEHDTDHGERAALFEQIGISI